MKSLLIASAATTTLLLLLGLKARAEVVDGIRALVHDAVITQGEVQFLTLQSADQLRRQYSTQGDEFHKRISEAERDNVEHLVSRQLILHEFKGYNVPETILDKDVDKRVEEIIREKYYGERMRLIKSLQAEGITYERFRQQIRDQFIEMALRSKNVAQEIIISPHKVETYYLAHRDDYKLAEEVKLRMIVLNRTGDTNAPDPKKLAEEVLSKLKEGAEFAELAKLYSQGSQARQGGDWGWYEPQKLRKEFAEAATKLKTGELSGVIETPDAYCLMLVEDIHPVRSKSLGEVRDEIEKSLKLEEQSRLEKQWIAKLRKKTFVQYY